MTRRTGWRHGLGLAICAFFAKAIGALYRLPLTNLLGAKGIGGYQLVFPVYAFVLALTSSAMPLLLARQIAKDGRFGYAVFHRSLSLMAISGGLGGAMLLAWSVAFAVWQGYADMAWGYALLAPAVLAVALSAPFRGWFNANMHWGALAGVGLCEQVLKVLGLGLAYLVRQKGVSAMTLAAIGGVAFAEVATLIYCCVGYYVLGYRLGKPPISVAAAGIWRSSLPITAANLVMPAVGFANSLLLVRLCVWGGADGAQAVESYGLYLGAVGTVTTLPVVLAMTAATIVIPVVSAAMQAGSWRKVRRGSVDTLMVVLSFGLPCGVGLCLLATDVVGLLYPALSFVQKAEASYLLRLSALGVPLVCLEQLYAVLLQSVDRVRQVAKQLAIGGAAQVALTCLMVPFWGMIGAVVAHLICYAALVVWHAVTYRNLTGRYALLSPLSRCMLALGGMAAVAWSLERILPQFRWRVVPIALLAALVYGILLWAAGGIQWLRRPQEEQR